MVVGVRLARPSALDERKVVPGARRCGESDSHYESRNTLPGRYPVACRCVRGLLHLESSLLRHYLRLQLAERDLSTFARNRRRGTGRGAVRQIDLERQRLGRELHTGVGQMLAAIRLQLEIVAASNPIRRRWCNRR